ncbi:MAG: DUF6544 family protein [Terracoccus sp.]
MQRTCRSIIPDPHGHGGGRIRTACRWIVAALVVAHGLIHLLGAAKGLGWAKVNTLSAPISPATGIAWLAAALFVATAGVLLALGTRSWWMISVIAAVLSQAVILTSWTDAKAGTVINVVLLAAVGYEFASQGPASYRAEYRRRAAAALDSPHPDTLITEADLALLPEQIASYVRRSGALGRPRVTTFRALIHGRIRSGATAPWMAFTGEQVNTYGKEPSRVFFIDATMFGLPVDVLHVYAGQAATMRVKVCSVVPIVNAAGADMDRAETVTMFNDLCVLAPAALIDAPVAWTTIDDDHIHGTFTNGAQTVSADLTFLDGILVNFVSDDRMAASRDGSSLTAQRWSTPLRDYRTINARQVATRGEGRWHAPEGEYAYLEYILDDIAYNPTLELSRRVHQRSTGDNLARERNDDLARTPAP